MQRDMALEQVLKHTLAVFNTGDVSGIDALVSREQRVLRIGTDPREWWVDEAVFGAFRAQVPEMHAAGRRFEVGDVHAYSEGCVGWVAARPTLKLPNGGEVMMRFTGVYRQEGGAWKLVQLHLSIGVASEEALGEALTI